MTLTFGLVLAVVGLVLLLAIFLDEWQREAEELHDARDAALDLLGAYILQTQGRETAHIDADELTAWYDSGLETHVDRVPGGVIVTIDGPEPAESEEA